MIIQLTEDEALTIADFLVNSSEAIIVNDKVTPETYKLLNAANQFIVQTWVQCDEKDKQMIIEEHRNKIKDIK